MLRAPWLTQGHATQAASDALWAGGWLHTGDVAARDPDGALRIVDRLKDVIKSGGEWVSTVELENLLEAEGSIAEAAVIGVPDAKWASVRSPSWLRRVVSIRALSAMCFRGMSHRAG